MDTLIKKLDNIMVINVRLFAWFVLLLFIPICWKDYHRKLLKLQPLVTTAPIPYVEFIIFKFLFYFFDLEP
ncbi:hypothetical protein AQUCO_00800122v1 [Aquilegia coerulea]|uniref:Uncharacterized protein n=1 Tax=Aquilegia coerulea TaxID=218851 RepID=A0A2G5EHW9_AQUCA|nr:hypothetical protein AQUCO_00800122v1 [Aquilegia coerulea]